MEENNTLDEPITWLEWFLLRDSAQIVSRMAKGAMFDTFNAERNVTQIQQNLIKNNGTVFLFKQKFGKNKINCFHHLSVIGGNIYNPQAHFGMIQGINEDVTSVVTPDKK